MSWNKVFDYFIEMKHKINKDFNTETAFIDLVEKFATQEQYNRIKDLQLTQHKNFLLIKYGEIIYRGEGESHKNFWEIFDGFYRECRSLVIDLVTEEMVLTPFSKFLNMNETEQDSQKNVVNRISNCKVFEISNKLDGSMVSARFYNGEYILSTSQSLNPTTSWRLQQAYDFLSDEIKALLSENSDFTFIFELISREDSHVVRYDETNYGLHLVGIRNSINGEAYSYKKTQEMAQTYKIKHTKVENLSFDEMVQSLQTIKSTEKEGYVLNIDGYRVKCKGDDYCNIHKFLSRTTSPNIIIKTVYDGNFDDLISKIPLSYKDNVLEIYEKIRQYQVKLTQDIDDIYKKIEQLPNTGTKASFMQAIQANCDANLKSFIISKYLKQPYDLLKSKNGKFVKLKEIEEYLNK